MNRSVHVQLGRLLVAATTLAFASGCSDDIRNGATALSTANDAAQPTQSLRTAWEDARYAVASLATTLPRSLALPQTVTTAETSVLSLHSEMPHQADSFADSFGFNTTFSNASSPYGFNYYGASRLLVASGVRHVREGEALPNEAYAAKMNWLCQHGVRFTVSFHINVTPQQITDIIHRFGDSCIDAVEPQNEYDSYPVPNWEASIRSQTQTIYQTVRRNPAFAHIVVMGPGLAAIWKYKYLGNMEAISDVGNMHDATCDGNPGTTYYRSLVSRINFMLPSWPTKPIWTSETDYGDNLATGNHCNVTDKVIAKYVARTQTERFNLGQARTYWYQLMEVPGGYYGTENFVTPNAVAKPQLTATANLISVVSDPGAAHGVRPLAYNLSGNVANVHHTLLQRRDGTYQLLLWLEVPSWDVVAHHELFPQSQRVTVSLQSSVTSALLHSYVNPNGSNFAMSANRLSVSNHSVTLNVTDAISVLSLR